VILSFASSCAIVSMQLSSESSIYELLIARAHIVSLTIQLSSMMPLSTSQPSHVLLPVVPHSRSRTAFAQRQMLNDPVIRYTQQPNLTNCTYSTTIDRVSGLLQNTTGGRVNHCQHAVSSDRWFAIMTIKVELLHLALGVWTLSGNPTLLQGNATEVGILTNASIQAVADSLSNRLSCSPIAQVCTDNLTGVHTQHFAIERVLPLVDERCLTACPSDTP